MSKNHKWLMPVRSSPKWLYGGSMNTKNSPQKKYGISSRFTFPTINCILFRYLFLYLYRYPNKNPEINTNIGRSIVSKKVEALIQRGIFGPPKIHQLPVQKSMLWKMIIISMAMTRMVDTVCSLSLFMLYCHQYKKRISQFGMLQLITEYTF